MRQPGNGFGTQAVETLREELAARLDALEAYPIEEELAEKGDLAALLKLALKNEVEASEIAAVWMPHTADVPIKLGFARQVGDEARHYRLIADHLGRMGVSLDGFNPMAQGYSPLFQALAKLDTTLEQLAAGQFTREAIAMRRNEMFIAYLERNGQPAVAATYRDHIQPDETHHHQLGVKGLERLITGEADLDKAREAMNLTLSIADEMKKAARQKVGAGAAIPGC